MTKQEALAELNEDYEYLKDNPGDIGEAWSQGESLFAMCRPPGPSPDCLYGCLTMIHGQDKPYVAADRNGQPDMDLTLEIIADTEIPTCVEDITRHHLPVFLKWQKRLINMYYE